MFDIQADTVPLASAVLRTARRSNIINERLLCSVVYPARDDNFACAVATNSLTIDNFVAIFPLCPAGSFCNYVVYFGALIALVMRCRDKKVSPVVKQPGSIC